MAAPPAAPPPLPLLLLLLLLAALPPSAAGRLQPPGDGGAGDGDPLPLGDALREVEGGSPLVLPAPGVPAVVGPGYEPPADRAEPRKPG